MPASQHDEIVRKFDGEEAKQQLFTTWLASYPCPSWEQVKHLLRVIGGEEGERAEDEVEETYLKSELEILGQWSNTVIESKLCLRVSVIKIYSTIYNNCVLYTAGFERVELLHPICECITCKEYNEAKTCGT